MKSIIFVTGNWRKVTEAKLACEPLGIEVLQEAYDIHEIQNDNPLEISEHKARSAFEIVNKPLVVTDTFWNIPALNGFPGAYMKDVGGKWFTPQDFILLMSDKEDKRIAFSENIVYIDNNQVKHFSKEFWGKIVPPRGTGLPIEQVAEFNGLTIGEQRERGDVSHGPEDYVWIDFAKWFGNIL